MSNLRKLTANFAAKAAEGPTYFDPNPDLGGDESRIRVNEAILESADNQIREYEPAKVTYERLISEGIHPDDARRFIAHLLALELFDAMKLERPYDEQRYLERLNNLPSLPSDEDEEG